MLDAIPNLDRLFTPYQFGDCTLRNRFVMSPMTRNMCPNGVPTDDVRAYYRSRAKGGVALIITEGVYINHPAANGEPRVPAFFGKECLDAWKRIVDEVHEEGALIVPQLWHNGIMRRPGIEPDPSVPGYGPMEIIDFGEVVVKEMDKQDIADVIEAYAEGAAFAQEFGFDGVQLHIAHEYLPDNFLWEKSNQRADEYGGSLENRLRLSLEITEAMRAAVSDDFPLWLRFSQWKLTDYDARIANDVDELERILKPLSEAGVDVFDVSTRRFWQPAFEGSDLSLAALTRQITRKPTMMVGGVGVERELSVHELGGQVKPSYDRLKDAVSGLDNEFDMVGLGRVLLSEPDWVKKVEARDFESIRPYSRASYDQLVI